MHHGRWTLSGDANAQLMFAGPDGQAFSECEAVHAPWPRHCTPREIALQHRRAGLAVDHTTISGAYNERLQLAWTVGNICDLEEVRLHRT